VHRDIKPSNYIYNSKTKQGIIIDFGVAEIDNSMINFLEKNKNNNHKLK